MTGPERAVRLRAIGRRFGWSWALRDLDLELTRGTALLLVGPNGAGKTTLLRILAAVLNPTRGEGAILGASLRTEGDEVRRRTALLTTAGHLYDELTAAENLRFAALMSGETLSGPAFAAILERVGLAAVTDRRVAGFSSGMRKRLAIGQLLLRSADMVLMDEPYASLDESGRALVDDIVTELKRAGRTVIMAAHQIGDSLRLIDRVACLEDGRLAFVCGPDELGERRRRRGAASASGSEALRR